MRCLLKAAAVVAALSLLASCSGTKESADVKASSTASPTNASWDHATVTTSLLTTPINRTGATQPLTDEQGYTYSASWLASYTVGQPDITNAPPGYSDISVSVTGWLQLANTSAGRNAPGKLLGAAQLLALFAADRAVCSGQNPSLLTLGGVKYCQESVASVADGVAAGGMTLTTPIPSGSSTEGSTSGNWKLEFTTDRVDAVVKDLSAGPTAWVLAARAPSTGLFPGDNYSGVAKLSSTCALPSSMVSDEKPFLWVSSALPGCKTMFTGSTVQVSKDAGTAAGKVVDQLFATRSGTTLDRCPALASADQTIRKLTMGFEGLDAQLVFDPVKVPQDTSGNTISCFTPDASPGGVFLRLGHADATEIDPQSFANEQFQAWGGHMIITDPVQLQNGTMIVTRSKDNGTWIAHWGNGSINISAYVGTNKSDPDQAKIDRIARWMAACLPTMLTNIANYS
jgi:hypothetical protein